MVRVIVIVGNASATRKDRGAAGASASRRRHRRRRRCFADDLLLVKRNVERRQNAPHNFDARRRRRSFLLGQAAVQQATVGQRDFKRLRRRLRACRFGRLDERDDKKKVQPVSSTSFANRCAAISSTFSRSIGVLLCN